MHLLVVKNLKGQQLQKHGDETPLLLLKQIKMRTQAIKFTYFVREHGSQNRLHLQVRIVVEAVRFAGLAFTGDRAHFGEEVQLVEFLSEIAKTARFPHLLHSMPAQLRSFRKEQKDATFRLRGKRDKTNLRNR